MASPTDIGTSPQTDFTARTIATISFAILYYDYALTLRTEVNQYWRKRWRMSPGIVGFFLNRYLGLFGHVPIILEFFDSKSMVTQNLQAYHQMLAGVMQLIIGALQVSRVYALHNRSRIVLFSLVALGIIVCSIGGWAIGQTWKTHCSSVTSYASSSTVQSRQCDPSEWRYQGRYLAIVWACLMVFDTLLLGLMLHPLLRVRKRQSHSLFSILIRDGVAFFAVSSACQLGNILVSLLANPAYRDAGVTITTVIATTMVSRMMFNMRDRKADSVYTLPITDEIELTVTL